MLPQLPRLVHRALSSEPLAGLSGSLERLADQNARRNDLLAALLLVALAGVVLLAAQLFY
jgi:hypothetical protein